MRRIWLVVAVGLGSWALAPVLLAATSLEGYSEAMVQLSDTSRVWRLGNPQFLAELRAKTSPWLDTEGFLKLQAFSNRWDKQNWKNFFFLKEGHLKYRGRRVEAYLFTGQDRFWLGEPLLGVVSGDVVKDDSDGPKAQGVRLDAWDLWGFTCTAFYSDKSTGYATGQDGDDYRAARVRKSMLADRMVVGATYGRKDYGGAKKQFDQVGAADLEVALGQILGPLGRFGRTSLFGELGRNFSGWLPDEEPYGWKLELRDVVVGPLSFIGSRYDYDNNFYASGLAKGDIADDNDYHGHYVQADYRVPMKAINLKAWRFRNKPHTEAGGRKPFEETGGEVYVEFQHGFKGKVEYKRHVNKDGTWPNVLFEVAGENRVVKIRTQFRVKDIGTKYELKVYGFEADANLTETWKFYTRLLTIDEKTEGRETVFAQIRYTGFKSAEFFLEFGDWNQSNDLVNTDWFTSHGNNDTTSRQFKTFLRLYY